MHQEQNYDTPSNYLGDPTEILDYEKFAIEGHFQKSTFSIIFIIFPKLHNFMTDHIRCDKNNIYIYIYINIYIYNPYIYIYIILQWWIPYVSTHSATHMWLPQ